MAYKYPFASASEELKLSVWVKGQISSGYNGNFYRRDAHGTWMQYSAHGETLSYFGWEIAHITPIANGGTDDLSNLQPLQWQNNRDNDEDLAVASHAATADRSAGKLDADDGPLRGRRRLFSS